jgi:hypothetical protein
MILNLPVSTFVPHAQSKRSGPSKMTDGDKKHPRSPRRATGGIVVQIGMGPIVRVGYFAE